MRDSLLLRGLPGRGGGHGVHADQGAEADQTDLVHHSRAVNLSGQVRH